MTLLLLLAGIALAQDPFEGLAAEAAEKNPTLDAMEARETALRSRSRVSGSWTDPMLSVEYSNAPIDSFTLTEHPMSGLQFRIEQTLPAFGSARLKRDATTSFADAQGARTREAELKLRTGVVEAGWLLTRTRMLEQVTREHLARTEELLGAVRARYETGAVGQHALLRMEVLRDQLEDQLGDYTRAERELTAALGAAMGQSEPLDIETPTEVKPIPAPAEADWLKFAEEHRPLLAQFDAEQAAAGHSASVAGRDVAPDVKVWAGYRLRAATTNDPGTDFVSLGVGVPIPSGGARRALGERTAWLEEASAAEIGRQGAVDRIAADVDTILARWQRASEKAKTHTETLIPGAQLTLETTRSDFSVGRAEFASLFEAEVALLDLERARITAAIETHLQQNALTATVGLAQETR